MSRWRERARARIAELVKDLPVDATVNDRKRALWGKGWPAHGGTSWGRKMWGKEVRAYLARFGDAKSIPSGSLIELEQSPDIHFPFREGDDG